jgi:hypothetical protein
MGTDDELEAREMHDGSPVVARDKNVSRLMTALIGVPGLLTMVLGVFVGLGNATASKPVPADVLPLVVTGVVSLGLALCVMAVAFSVLRTVVTERAVHVRYGLWGPTIPLESIRSCKVVDYDWTQFGGWGIRRGRGGTWAYVPASSGPVMEITYVDGGTEKRVLVGAGDAAGTARQIEEARKKTAEHARVAAPHDAAAPIVDEEFEADEASANQRRANRP